MSTPAVASARQTKALVQVGERIRAARLRQGLTQEALAFGAQIHPTYVSGVERGQRNLGVANLLRIAAVLETDPAELVRGLRL